MRTDSEEMKKLRAAGFNHSQAKAVLKARAMANDGAREDAISDMLRTSGFAAPEAQVIASSACRHAQTNRNRAEFMPGPSTRFGRTPRPGFPPYAVAAVLGVLIAIAIVVIAPSFTSTPSTRSATAPPSAPMAVHLSPAARPSIPPSSQKAQPAERPVQPSPTAGSTTPGPAEELVFRDGKFVRVPRVSGGTQAPVTSPSSRQPSSEEEWRREAAREFPSLPIKGTPFNSLFVSEYHRLRASSSSFFQSPDWPMLLARTCHRYLSRYGLSPTSPGDSASAYLPTAGAILFELYPGSSGPGKLSVSNGSTHHAICKLIDLKTGAKIYTFVVLPNSSHQLSGIPNGTYRVIFAYGDAIISGTDQFAAPEGFTAFRETFEFATKRTATGFEYSTSDVALDQGTNGNTRIESVSAEEFNRY